MTEADVLARLEQWRLTDRDYRNYTIKPHWMHLVSDNHRWVVVYQCPSESRDYSSQADQAHVVIAGTDAQPASVAECILAALAKWQELYGEG